MSVSLPVPGPTVVMDASVIAKYMLPQESADSVQDSLPRGADQIAPSIIEFEVRSLLSKHVRRGNFTKESAEAALLEWEKALNDEWVWIVPATDYADEAFRLSCIIHHPFYDCCYLALSIQTEATLITADRKLYERGKAIYPNILLTA